MKQINKHHEDGSYSYGYEAADGTYKIETKYSNGEVYGKYGYFDDQGQLREVEYGASRRGFEPAGSEITVAPPTVNNNNNNYPPPPLGPEDEDDGQYREDPSVYYQNEQRDQPQQNNYRQPVYTPRYTQPVQKNSYQEPVRDIFEEFQSRPASRPQPAYQRPRYEEQPRPVYQQQERPVYREPEQYQRPAYRPQSYQQPSFRPSSNFGFQQQQQQQPSYNPPPPQPQPQPQPSYNPYNNYNTQYHPKDPNVNVDYFSGSYSVNYK